MDLWELWRRKELIQEFGGLLVVQIQLEEGMGRVFLDKISHVQDMAAKELPHGCPKNCVGKIHWMARGGLVVAIAIVMVVVHRFSVSMVGQIGNPPGQIGKVARRETFQNRVPVGKTPDPILHGPKGQEEGRVWRFGVKVFQQGKLGKETIVLLRTGPRSHPDAVVGKSQGKGHIHLQDRLGVPGTGGEGRELGLGSLPHAQSLKGLGSQVPMGGREVLALEIVIEGGRSQLGHSKVENGKGKDRLVFSMSICMSIRLIGRRHHKCSNEFLCRPRVGNQTGRCGTRIGCHGGTVCCRQQLLGLLHGKVPGSGNRKMDARRNSKNISISVSVNININVNRSFLQYRCQ